MFAVVIGRSCCRAKRVVDPREVELWVIARKYPVALLNHDLVRVVLYRPQLTNDLRYESNDSREILNCSFSSNAHRCNDDDVVDRDDVVPQKLFFSVGDGGR